MTCVLDPNNPEKKCPKLPVSAMISKAITFSINKYQAPVASIIAPALDPYKPDAYGNSPQELPKQFANWTQYWMHYEPMAVTPEKGAEASGG